MTELTQGELPESPDLWITRGGAQASTAAGYRRGFDLDQ